MTGRSAERIGYQEGSSELNNVIAFLERHRRDRPDKAALVWVPAEAGGDPTAHDSMSCAQLAARVESAASGLSRLGVAAGDRVFIFVPMSPQLYVAMFAVQRLGAAAVFLDSWARRGQLGSCAAQVGPRAFIGPEAAFALTEGVPELRSAGIRVVVGPHGGKYSASLEELAAAGGSCPVQPVEREHTALITFTTGSSGPPKGADRTHRFLAAQHEALDRCLPYAEDDVDLPVFPIFSLNNIAGGVTTVLPAVDLARASQADGRRLLTQIEAAGATCCTLSPWLLRAVAAAGEGGAGMRSVRRIATGGAPISADDVAAVRRAAPDAELHILYGSTEVEPIAHLIASDMPPVAEGGGVCVGALASGLDHRLIRIRREPVELGPGGWPGLVAPEGEAGELVVAGEHVCANYYRNEEAFRRAKIVDGDRVWHRTGDVCRFDADGRLWVEGRVHSAICRAGEILLPVGPEIVMKRLPFVRAAAYLGLPDRELGERAAAVFSVKPENAGERDLGNQIRSALEAAGLIVDEVVAVEEIPLDPRHHSKVEYAVLRERILEGRAGR